MVAVICLMELHDLSCTIAKVLQQSKYLQLSVALLAQSSQDLVEQGSDSIKVNLRLIDTAHDLSQVVPVWIHQQPKVMRSLAVQLRSTWRISWSPSKTGLTVAEKRQ